MKSKIAHSTIKMVVAASLGLILGTAIMPALAQTKQLYPPPPTETNQPYPHRDTMMGPGNQHHRMYDPNTVQTIQGQVVRTEIVNPGGGRAGGMHLWLKTGEQTITVHLGPSGYLESQGFRVAPGDEIEVTGSLVDWDGGSAIIASQVRHGQKVWQLRDSKGIPVWRGQNPGWNRQGGVGEPCCY
jgi:hypothetical protein